MTDVHLFSSEIRNTFLIHIPHSSLIIPNPNDFLLNNDELELENLKSTDIAIGTIFDVGGIKSVTYPFSRLFCDVEKLPINEDMDVSGRGIYYTKTTDLKDLRKFSLSDYWNILTNHYLKHHNKMVDRVETILNDCETVRIIDAHSFNGFNEHDPDICIGIDEFHTPKYLIDHVVRHFEKNGFSVKINDPYSGTYVPLPYYEVNDNVESIMIEINKRLYCDTDFKPIHNKVEKLNKIVIELFEF